MYNYSILKDIRAETTDIKRVYKTPIGDLPSITTILGATSPNNAWLDIWRARVGIEEAKRISKVATDRGELIHGYAENHFNGDNVEEKLIGQPIDIKQMTRDLIKIAQSGITKVYAQELALYSKILKAAGRLDLVGEWKGTPALVDFKTSKKKKTSSQIADYYLQVCFYSEAHNELFSSKIKKAVILIAVENDEPQIFEINTMPFLGNLKHRINTYYKNYEN